MIDPATSWILRVVQPDSSEPAPGVPVSLLDAAGTPAGYWVSDADGHVAIPKIDATRVRLRVGLRSEEPIELDVTALESGTAQVTAPATLAPVRQSSDHAPATTRDYVPAPADLAPNAQTLRFSRLAVFPAPSDQLLLDIPDRLRDEPVDFFAPTPPPAAGIRYGAVIEVEQYWQSLGYVSGDLLYTAALAPGEDLGVAIVDTRWEDPRDPPHLRRSRGRPLDVTARLVAEPALMDALDEDGTLPLAPVTVDSGAPRLAVAGAETIHDLMERTLHAAAALRRRTLRIVEVGDQAPPGTVRRQLRNRAAQPVAYHFFEPLERFRVGARAARVRPAVLIPFQLPNLATRPQVQRFGTMLRRVLLDKSLLPDLEWVMSIGTHGPSDPAQVAPPVSELRIVVQSDPLTPPVDLRQVWCFLHVDQTRYTIHFFPAETVKPAAPSLAPPLPLRWVGAIRLADLHQRPLRFPGHLTLENGSRTMLSFAALHLEGRAGDDWKRLLSIPDFVLTGQSRAQLASLAQLAETPGLDPREARLLGHIATNLPYYAAACIAAGDATLRHLALAKVQDADGRPLADLIENRIVGLIGNYIACPLRSVEGLPRTLRATFAAQATHRPIEEIAVTLPLPGIWLSQQDIGMDATTQAIETESDDVEPRERRLLGGRWRGGASGRGA